MVKLFEMYKANNLLKKKLLENNLFLDEKELIDKLPQIIKDCQKSFLLEDQARPLPMLESRIATTLNPSVEKKIVIDAGGTNFRIMFITQKEKKLVIEKFKKYPMPGSKKEITKKAFFEKIADYILPFLKEMKGEDNVKIGFCFSYPVEVSSTGEGFVSYLSKEIKIKGITKIPLIKSIKNVLFKKVPQLKKKSLEFVLINDTVATLLAGKFFNPKSYLNHLGLVIGTGFNIALEKKNQIYNSEIGTYAYLPKNKIDRFINDQSVREEVGLAEKRISGKYFDGIFLFYLKFLAGENFFSKELNNYLVKIKSLKMVSIYNQMATIDSSKDFLINQKKITFSEDIKKLKDLFQFVVYASSFYAAFLTFVLICSIIPRSQKTDKKRILISGTGSMLERCPFYFEYYQKNLQRLCRKKGYLFTLSLVDNSSAYGSFLAKFLNETK